MPKNPSDYALVIGVNDYPSFRSLQGAIRDAKDVRDWLVDDVIGGGVPPAQCGEVYSKLDPLEPFNKMVDLELERLVDLAAKNGGSRRFYLYFSGHGLGVDHNTTALCLADWSDKHRHEALDAADYAKYLREVALFKEVIILLDCCRVKKVNGTGLPTILGLATPNPGAGACRQFLAHATEALDASYEAAAGPNGTEVRGHFTQALLEALNGACSSPAGGVTVDALKAYIEAETSVIANMFKHEQTPEVENGLPANPPVLFGSAPRITKVQVNIAMTPRVGDVVLEANLTEIKRAPASSSADWTGLDLDPGLYSLADTVSKEKREFCVRPTRRPFNVSF